MANATRSGKPRNLGMPLTSKYIVAADNDIIFENPTESILVIGMVCTGSVTGFTFDGVDYVTSLDTNTVQDLPALLVADGAKDVTAQATGAGTITLIYFVVPTVTAGYTETAYTQV